jgi:hypothetical protein
VWFLKVLEALVIKFRDVEILLVAILLVAPLKHCTRNVVCCLKAHRCWRIFKLGGFAQSLLNEASRLTMKFMNLQCVEMSCVNR